MSIEHKTSEALSGKRIGKDGVIEMDGKRIVAVNGPTFQQQYLVPITNKRQEVATLLLAQLAELVVAGDLAVDDIWNLADKFVMHEVPSLQKAIPAYFDQYLANDRTVEDILNEANIA